MRALIFYHVAEYADFAAKVTLKWEGRRIQEETWDNANGLKVKTRSYFTDKRAETAFQEFIGKMILGGWQVLNLYPKKVEWKEDTK